MILESLAQFGGAERSFVLLANGLVERGHRATVIVRAGGAPKEAILDPRVAVDVLPSRTADKRRWIRVPTLIISLLRRFRGLRPNVVVAFKPENTIPALAAGAITRTPVVASERTSLQAHRHFWHWRLSRRLLYRTAAAIVVQTERTAPVVRRLAPSAPMAVIPNMVDRPGDGSQESSVWARFPGGPPPRRLITVGRLAHEKGIDRLIDIFAELADSFPEWSLAIVGGGPQELELRKRANAAGIEDKVFFPGAVDDPFPSLADSDVFALTSHYEGFPNALLEAMTVGLAVIAYDCLTGPRELISDRENGLLIPDGNHQAFVKALADLMRDPALRDRLGKRAETVAEIYAPNRVVEQWEVVLRDASKGPSTVPVT